MRNEYGDPLRTIYLTNDIVKVRSRTPFTSLPKLTVIQQIILNNDYTRMRLISAGIKSFTRQDSATSKNSELVCKWRPPIDGILELLPHLGDGVLIQGTLSELRTLLEDHYPALEKFKRSEWKEEMEKREMGAAIVKFNAGNSDGGELKLPMYLPIWKAKMSLSLMIDKREKR